MKDLKIKMIMGFRKEQEYTVDADEAHKAYYLFLNPDKRGVFEDGLAVIGADIRRIEPDYNATMGWVPTHVLVASDWEEIEEFHVARKLKNLLGEAKRIAIEMPDKINLPLSEILELPANDNLQLT